jgi:hypothetical protein
VTNRKAGNKTMLKASFKWNQRTKFLNIENKTRETRSGQKEVWTVKKGDINTMLTPLEIKKPHNLGSGLLEQIQEQ